MRQYTWRRWFSLLGLGLVAACQGELITPQGGPTPLFTITYTPDSPFPCFASPGTCIGFVGKGDVQFTYGWSNKQLQDGAANVRFRAHSTKVTELSWVCHKFTPSGNEIEVERQQTTVTTLQALLSSIARDSKKQITGFNLTGFDGTPNSNSVIAGPALNSCQPGFSLDTAAGDPEVISDTTELEVSNDSGASWTTLLEKPQL
jgi:hypothetical protein